MAEELVWEDGAASDDCLIAASIETGLVRGMPAGALLDSFETVVYLGITDTLGRRHMFAFLDRGHAAQLCKSLLDSIALLDSGES